jgi:hypothetical protein
MPTQEQNISMSPTQFKEMMQSMLQTIVSEIRKPPYDPVKEVQKAREKETKEKANKEMWEKRYWKLTHCAHSRQDGTCVIGWAKQSDDIERGYCPNCDNLIGPELAIAFPEKAAEMKELYQALRRRPRGLMEAVRYIA